MRTLVGVSIPDDSLSQLCGDETCPLSMLAERIKDIVYMKRVFVRFRR